MGERGELRVRLGDRHFAAQIEAKRSDLRRGPHPLYHLAAAFISVDEASRLHLKEFIGEER